MEMIGFVGLGTIGGAIAGNIRQAGYPMMVHDIRSQAIQPPVDGDPGGQIDAEVARHCRVVFTSLPGPPEVEEVALGAQMAFCKEFAVAASTLIFLAAIQT